MSKGFWIGIILLIAGLVVALRGASFKEDKGGIEIGDAKIHVVERHGVPNWMGWTAVGVGAILVVGGLRGRSGSRAIPTS